MDPASGPSCMDEGHSTYWNDSPRRDSDSQPRAPPLDSHSFSKYDDGGSFPSSASVCRAAPRKHAVGLFDLINLEEEISMEEKSKILCCCKRCDCWHCIGLDWTGLDWTGTVGLFRTHFLSHMIDDVFTRLSDVSVNGN